MDERTGEAFQAGEPLTVVGARLRPGDPAPPFELLHYGPNDAAPHTVRLADTAGMVRLLHVVNSLTNAVCDADTRRFEQLRADLPPGAVVYTVSADPPETQQRWCSGEAIMHEVLSAHGDERFGRDYGVLIREWRRLQRALFVIDRTDRIAYAEYVADQQQSPDFAAAGQALRQAAA